MRLLGALALGDQPIVLRLPVEREVEDVGLDLAAAVQVAVGHDQLVAQGAGLGHDLAGWRDDAALATPTTQVPFW